MTTFSYFQHYPRSLLDPLLFPTHNSFIRLSAFDDQTPLYALPNTSTLQDSCNVDQNNKKHSCNITPGSSSGDHHVPSTTGKPRRRKSRYGSNSKEGVERRKSKKQRKCSSRDVKEKRGSEEEELHKDYIHVRARRGQATDSHSLAERVRREKIRERMNKLQDLVPGCDKVTGKALVLDEIINYVQSLQNQVELLSMKLASISPMVYDFGLDLDGPEMGTQTTLFPSLLDDSIIPTQTQLQEEGEKFVEDRSGLNSNNLCSFS